MKQTAHELNISKQLQRKYGIIGESRPILDVVQRLMQAAPTDLAVLITGETGTGKEVFANALHKLSHRKKFPFISVNCGAIPETLLESELFGHERGAFTGASDQRMGFFEAANNGTIFLDEIGEMPVGTQVKLLRILESGEFSRLGSSDMRKVNVRLVAATNKNLEQAVQSGHFRQDLYFRLKSVQIILPPLREHPEDIPLLVDFFASKVCEKLGHLFKGVSEDAMAILKKQHYPGNVRELRNLIESVVTLEQSDFITADQLRQYITPALPAYSYTPPDPTKTLVHYSNFEEPHRFEMEIIFRTLLELKTDTNDIKQAMTELSMQINELKEYQVEVVSVKSNASETEIYDTIDEEDNLRLDEMERKLINHALHISNGNRRKAAKILGISERTLYRKLLENNIES
jgi:transcriptional regulator with PAS, ATPase and Fis domain